MARLTIHIGPPKTATTALQTFMQSLAISSLKYGGVYQPRQLNDGSLSQRLYLEASSSDYNCAEFVVQEIVQFLDSGRNVFLSEEMFLVDGIGKAAPSHQAKIAHLARLLEKVKVHIVVCVRDPVMGLKSLYQELHHALPLEEKKSFSRFLRGNQALVFDYEHLDQLLRNCGFEKVEWITFDELTSGRLSLKDLLGESVFAGTPVALDQLNVGRGKVGKSRIVGGTRIGKIVKPSRWFGVSQTQALKRVPGLEALWRKVSSVSVGGRSLDLVVPEALEAQLVEKMKRVCSL